jgi:hypothetical protein
MKCVFLIRNLASIKEGIEPPVALLFVLSWKVACGGFLWTATDDPESIRIWTLGTKHCKTSTMRTR